MKLLHNYQFTDKEKKEIMQETRKNFEKMLIFQKEVAKIKTKLN